MRAMSGSKSSLSSVLCEWGDTDLASEITERTKTLHYESFIFDFYPLALPLIIDDEDRRYVHDSLASGKEGNSILYGIFYRYVECLESGGETARLMKNRLEEALKKTGVNCIAVTMGDPVKPLSDYESIVNSIAWWKRVLKNFDLLVECHTAEDIEQAYVSGKIAIILALQDGGCIGNSLGRLDALYESGVRIIQLTYNTANSIGHGCAEPPDKGLTEFGKQAVERMNRLGIVVDLSHCNYQTTMDGIQVSAKPVAFTHSGCRNIYNHPRSQTEEELIALAKNDGYMGVFTVPSFLSDNPYPEFDLFIKHFRSALQTVGLERIGVGSDWGLWSPDVPKELSEAMIQSAYKMGFSRDMKIIAGTSLQGMDDYTDWIKITEAFVGAGYSDDQIKAFLGGNFLKFWRRATAG